MHNKGIEIKAISTVLIGFFALFLLFPAVMMVGEAFSTETGYGLQNFISVFKSATFMKSIGNSFVVSSVSAFVTMILAMILAYTVHYSNIPKWLKSTIKVLL